MSARALLGGAVCWPPGDFAFFFLLVLRFFFLPVIVSPLQEDCGYGRPTIYRLANELYGGSNIVVLVLPVFAFAVE